MSSKTRTFFILILIAISSVIFSISKGSTSFSLIQLFFARNNPLLHTIIFKLRLPRTLTAFVSGGLLAVSGVLMQVLLQNPLADPYILGISGGAAFFTLLLMLKGYTGGILIVGAWLGSGIASMLLILLSRRHKFQTFPLLLTGLALSSAFAASITLILLLSPSRGLPSMLYWLSGDLNMVEFSWSALGILLLVLGISFLLAPALNLLTRGNQAAESLGIAQHKYRLAIFCLSSLAAAAAVTIVGCIGFIGLIIPHLTRLIVGFNHRLVLPCAVLLGGSLLTLADTCARALLDNQQLPVGVLLTFIGIPIFILLLQKT